MLRCLESLFKTNEPRPRDVINGGVLKEVVPDISVREPKKTEVEIFFEKVSEFEEKLKGMDKSKGTLLVSWDDCRAYSGNVLSRNSSGSVIFMFSNNSLEVRADGHIRKAPTSYWGRNFRSVLSNVYAPNGKSLHSIEYTGHMRSDLGSLIDFMDSFEQKISNYDFILNEFKKLSSDGRGRVLVRHGRESYALSVFQHLQLMSLKDGSYIEDLEKIAEICCLGEFKSVITKTGMNHYHAEIKKYNEELNANLIFLAHRLVEEVIQKYADYLDFRHSRGYYVEDRVNFSLEEMCDTLNVTVPDNIRAYAVEYLNQLYENKEKKEDKFIQIGTKVKCIIPDDSNHLFQDQIYEVIETKNYDGLCSHLVITGNGYTGGLSTYATSRFEPVWSGGVWLTT